MVKYYKSGTNETESDKKEIIETNGLKRIGSKEKKYGFSNEKNEIIITPIFLDALEFSDGLAAVSDYPGFWGYIDTTGKWKINQQYKEVKSFSNGTAWVKHKKKWGKLNKQGKWVIEPQYDDVQFIQEDYAFVQIGKKWGILKTDGSWMHIPFCDKVEPTSFGYLIKADRKFGFVDTLGNVTVMPRYLGVRQNAIGDYIIVEDQENHFIYVDLYGNPVPVPDGLQTLRRFSDGIAEAKFNGKWGYINDKGGWVIEPIYDRTRPHENGFCPVMKDELWGVINTKGEVKIEFKYLNMGTFKQVNFK